MNLLFNVSIFAIGVCVGSFLNVLIDRLPRGESIVKGGSHCESCKKRLIWYELIPLVSFFVLRRRCRYCHSPIGWYYPVVELTTGVLFTATFLFLKNNEGILNIELIYYLLIISSLVVVFFSDLKYGIIPDKVLSPAIIISFLFLFLILNSRFLILNSALSGLGAFIFFFLLFLITKGKGMGFGDVKLAFLLGLFLGFPKIIIALYIAFLTGAWISLILVLWGKKKFFGGTIPLGPFLVLGTLVSLFYGENILNLVLP